MGLTCNIDRRGKRARAIVGAVFLLVGAALAIAAWRTGEPLTLGLPAGLAILAGAFGLFEAANGWCAVRAMGFKTPL